jgi:tetratricopeptide (TPR) repeat protein
MQTLTGHGAPVTSVAFSPDCRRLLSGAGASGKSGEAKVWDAVTGKDLFALEKPHNSVTSVSFSPDGQRLATGGEDTLVRVWDAATGQPLFIFKGHAEAVSSVAFSPDGRWLASGSRDRTVKLWPATPRKDQRSSELVLLDRLNDEASQLRWHRRQATDSQTNRRWFAATFHLNRLLKAEPEDPRLHYERGVALANQGQGAEARGDFETALAMKERLTLKERADLYGWLGQTREAASAMADLVKGLNNAAWEWGRYAIVQLSLGDAAGYAATCQEVLRRFSKTRTPDIGRRIAAWCAVAPGALPDMTPALRLAERAVAAEGERPDSHNTLGMVLYRLGRNEEAAKEFSRAIELGWQDDAYVLFFAAMAQHRWGKTKEARACFDQALQGLQKDPPINWVDRLELDYRRKEAEAVLNETRSQKE